MPLTGFATFTPPLKSIIHIVGNRPQFIKLAVMHRELAKSGVFRQEIIHSGQHFSPSMSDIFFDELSIPEPDKNLNINQVQTNMFVQLASHAIEQCLRGRPSSDIVFVYGDTNTTLAAAIAAKKAGLTLVHFEAGVRTQDETMPEEQNRKSADALADLNFCCTSLNYQNMLAENSRRSDSKAVLNSGDLMLDAFLTLNKPGQRRITEKNYIACTLHRDANVNNADRLHSIVAALNSIHAQIPVILPAHPNTVKRLNQFGCQPGFRLLEPMGYADMKRFLSEADFIITDSGGSSREAYFLGKKSLVLMDRPFWPEIIAGGCALSAGADEAQILSRFFALPQLTGDFSSALFGDGHAAGKIRTALESI